MSFVISVTELLPAQVHLEFLPQVTQVPIDLVLAFHDVVFKDVLKLVFAKFRDYPIKGQQNKP